MTLKHNYSDTADSDFIVKKKKKKDKVYECFVSVDQFVMCIYKEDIILFTLFPPGYSLWH